MLKQAQRPIDPKTHQLCFVVMKQLRATFRFVSAMQAAELFEVENSSSEANKCRLKIAQFSAELERFPVAIEIYESIAKSQVDNNLLKFSAKGNLLNAGLCRLNGTLDLLVLNHSCCQLLRSQLLYLSRRQYNQAIEGRGGRGRG